MKRNLLILGLFASLALGSTTWAQVPAVPAAPVAAPAAPGNLWTFLMPNKEQCSHIKTCFCESGIGQMVSGMAGPFSLMSGGLIKNRCLQNSILNDLKKGADTPAGAAAAIAADAAEAKARRESVRALGLVDCNYWPEAIDVLKTSLRKDRSECVRYEAALALRNGCCCNKETIKALEMCVSGSNADGFPAERSDRVRAAAAEALARCPIIETEEDKTKGKTLTKNMLSPNVDPAAFYKKVSQMSDEQVIASARATLASVQQASRVQAAGSGATTTVGAGSVPAIHQRAGSLAGIVSNAFGGNADPQTRTPFFSSLTRSLTGKQENTVQQYVVPAGSNNAHLPEIQTANPTEISVPLPAGEASKPQVAPSEIAPSAEFMNPPRDKKVVAPRDLPIPAQSGGDYIQVSPHVRQLQPVFKASAPMEMTPAIPVPMPLPSTTVPSALPTSTAIVPVTFIATPAAPASNITVVNMPPATPSTTPVQVRESRPTLPAEIFQSTSGQPRESRGTVTIEIGDR